MNFRNFTLIIITVIFASSCNKEASKATSTEPTEYEKKIAQKQKYYGERQKSAGVQQQKGLEEGVDRSAYKDYYEKGKIKHNQGDFTGAISDFTNAIDLKTDFADVWGFRGMSKYKSGDKSGACLDWKKAMELGHTTSESLLNQYCNP